MVDYRDCISVVDLTGRSCWSTVAPAGNVESPNFPLSQAAGGMMSVASNARRKIGVPGSSSPCWLKKKRIKNKSPFLRVECRRK